MTGIEKMVEYFEKTKKHGYGGLWSELREEARLSEKWSYYAEKHGLPDREGN